jgi:hypothetical protein
VPEFGLYVKQRPQVAAPRTLSARHCGRMLEARRVGETSRIGMTSRRQGPPSR